MTTPTQAASFSELVRGGASAYEPTDPTTMSAFFLAARLGRRNDAMLESIARRHGVTAAELYVLAPLLLQSEELTVSALGQAVLQTSGGVTKTVTRLEDAGLVRKRVDPSDARVRLVRITAAGKRVVTRCLDDALHAYEEILALVVTEPPAALVDRLAELVDAAELVAERHADPQP